MGNFDRGGGSSRGRSFGGRSFAGRGGGRDFNRGERREMHKAVCSNCGNGCEVPFRPTAGKPIYCSDCFEKMGGRRQDAPRPQRSDFRAQSVDQNKNQFDSLNAKLDKIISLLEPKVSVPVLSAPVATAPSIKEKKETTAPKVKKVAKKIASSKKK